MSFMPSEVLAARSTVIDSKSVEVKANPFPISPPEAAPAPKHSTPDAIFAVIPHNTDIYGPYGKPNAIVRPVVRRNESNEMTLPQAHEANAPASDHSTPKVNVPVKNKTQEIDTFTKELENKLEHLQKDSKSSTGNVKFHIN